MLGTELKLLRRGLIVVLAVLLFSVTAFAFSSVGHERWSSKLKKGKYRGTVNEETKKSESIQPNIYVIVSDPIQIQVNIDGLATDTDEEPIEEQNEIVGEYGN